jgi:hypothetical protein
MISSAVVRPKAIEFVARKRDCLLWGVVRGPSSNTEGECDECIESEDAWPGEGSLGFLLQVQAPSSLLEESSLITP